MTVKNPNISWSHALFVAVGLLNLVYAVADVRITPFRGIFHIIGVAAFVALGTVGWQWVVRRQNDRLMLGYFAVQIVLAHTLEASFLRDMQEYNIISLFAVPVVFQVGFLRDGLRYGLWLLLLAPAAYLNLRYDSGPVPVLASSLVLAFFAYAGVIAARNMALIEQIQRLKEQAERRYLAEKEQYDHLNEMRDQFIHSATHDLKNPLNIFVGYLSLLESEETISGDSTLSRYLTQMRGAADKMQMLVMDMLDLAQLRTAHDLKLQPTPVKGLLYISVQEYMVMAGRKNIRLTVDPGDDSLTILVDRNRFQRVIENLLSNAIKYTAEGGDVTLMAERSNEDVLIRVQDTGMGIPKDSLPQLFQSFYRVEAKAHYEIEGTGLGLAIVKGIVEQHGGTVTVHSILGDGSTFTVSLPAYEAQDTSAPS